MNLQSLFMLVRKLQFRPSVGEVVMHGWLFLIVKTWSVGAYSLWQLLLNSSYEKQVLECLTEILY